MGDVHGTHAAGLSVHVTLTDILTCPRCGPSFGLVLLADRVADRRVQEGVLGCPNCREQYPVRGGAGDFGGSADLPAASVDEAARMRLAALLGVTHGPGVVLVAGPASAHASGLAAMLEHVEVVATPCSTAATAPAAGRVGTTRADAPRGVSRIGLAVGADRLPLASGRLLGAALTGRAADALLEEGARVLAPMGRLVLDPVPADAAERLARARLRLLAESGGVAVAMFDPRLESDRN